MFNILNFIIVFVGVIHLPEKRQTKLKLMILFFLVVEY